MSEPRAGYWPKPIAPHQVTAETCCLYRCAVCGRQWNIRYQGDDQPPKEMACPRCSALRAVEAPR